MGDSPFAFFKIHAPLYGRAFFSGNRGVYSTAFGNGDSFYNGLIGSVNLSFFHLSRENRSAEGVFCQNQQSRGIPVQAVDAAEDKRFSLLCVIPGRAVCQGVVIVIDRRVYRHVCGLVQKQNIFILINNRQRHGNRNNVLRRGVFR